MLWRLLGFTSIQGWCSEYFPSVSPHNLHNSAFWILPPQPSTVLMLIFNLLKPSCQTHCCHLFLSSPRVPWEVTGTHLAPVPLGAAVDYQNMLQGCCSGSFYCGCRDSGATPWPCCCSLLCWPGNCSKGGIGARDKWWKAGRTELWTI